VKLWIAGVLLLPAALAQNAPNFEFHSGFWLNLHHYLYEQASPGGAVASDTAEWRRAVDYYRREMVNRDMLSREMEAINNSLADRETAASLRDSGLPSELIAILEAAAPEYRQRWWPVHDATNWAWIAAARPLIDKYGGALTGELTAAFGTSWPDGPIRTDVAEYANWAGAYTTLEPTHITISSTVRANAGQAALEILFHEASHSLISGVFDALSREAREQGKLLRQRDLWHALLFYTAGELTSRHLPGYTPYAIANGLYDRAWPGALPVFNQDWKPYLDGTIDRATAIRRIVEHHSVAPAN